MRFRRSLGASVAAMSPDADLSAWAATVVANGGTVSADRAAVVGQFIATEKANGTWALTDDYLGFWGEDAAQALTSLKQRRLATVTGSPTFSASRHYAFDGSTNYIDTGFIPDTHAVAMGINSVHLEAYDRQNASGGTTAGASSTSSRTVRLVSRTTGNCTGYGNSDVATYTLPASTSLGLTQIGRSAGAVTDSYGSKNGVAMTRTGDPTALGATLPSHSLYIGGLNNAGSFSSGRVCQIGFAAWGAALTEAQRLARYNAVVAWGTAVGAI